MARRGGGLAKRTRQVRAEARLRFGPQRRQLKQAIREVDAAHREDVRIANQAAKGAKRAARTATPMVDKAFDQALATTTAGPTPGESAQLGSLGPAAARDSENTRRRLAETAATTKAELAQRVIDAESGRSSAVRAARETKLSQKARLRQQYVGLTGDAGVFRQARLGELEEEAADRRVTKRGQDKTLQGSRERTAAQNRRHSESLAEQRRHNTETEKTARKNAAKGPGKSKATNAQTADAQSQIALARQQAQRLRDAEKRGRGEAGQFLVEGRDDATLKVDDKGKPLPQPVKVPGVKKVDQLWASVALDLEYDGVLSRTNLKRLRKLGYGANRLGIGKYKPPTRGAGNRAANRSPGSDRAQG